MGSKGLEFLKDTILVSFLYLLYITKKKLWI